MLTYPWHRAEIMRNTPDFTPKSAQNAYKQKITVADIVSTTVTDLMPLGWFAQRANQTTTRYAGVRKKLYKKIPLSSTIRLFKS